MKRILLTLIVFLKNYSAETKPWLPYYLFPCTTMNLSIHEDAPPGSFVANYSQKISKKEMRNVIGSLVFRLQPENLDFMIQLHFSNDAELRIVRQGRNQQVLACELYKKEITKQMLEFNKRGYEYTEQNVLDQAIRNAMAVEITYMNQAASKAIALAVKPLINPVLRPKNENFLAGINLIDPDLKAEDKIAIAFSLLKSEY